MDREVVVAQVELAVAFDDEVVHVVPAANRGDRDLPADAELILPDARDGERGGGLDDRVAAARELGDFGLTGFEELRAGPGELAGPGDGGEEDGGRALGDAELTHIVRDG